MKGGISQMYVKTVIAPLIKNGHGERIRSMAWDLCFDLDHIVGGPRWKRKRRFAFRVGFNGVQVSVLTFVPKRGVERELALARRYMAQVRDLNLGDDQDFAWIRAATQEQIDRLLERRRRSAYKPPVQWKVNVENGEIVSDRQVTAFDPGPHSMTAVSVQGGDEGGKGGKGLVCKQHQQLSGKRCDQRQPKGCTCSRDGDGECPVDGHTSPTCCTCQPSDAGQCPNGPPRPSNCTCRTCRPRGETNFVGGNGVRLPAQHGPARTLHRKAWRFNSHEGRLSKESADRHEKFIPDKSKRPTHKTTDVETLKKSHGFVFEHHEVRYLGRHDVFSPVAYPALTTSPSPRTPRTARFQHTTGSPQDVLRRPVVCESPPREADIPAEGGRAGGRRVSRDERQARAEEGHRRLWGRQSCRVVSPRSIVERGLVDDVGEGAAGTRQGGDDQRELDVAEVFKLFHTALPIRDCECMAHKTLPKRAVQSRVEQRRERCDQHAQHHLPRQAVRRAPSGVPAEGRLTCVSLVVTCLFLK